MRLWVFSDLHLTHPQSFLYTSFLKALEEPQSETDTVVFAGDIFDRLVGDSNYFRSKYSAFIETLKKLNEKKVKLFYIEGNHDFHLKNFFKGVDLKFEEEAVLLSAETLSGKKMIYIGHGDLVNEADSRYLRLRRFFRSRPIQFLSECLPGKSVEWVGKRLSRPLSQKAKELPENWDPDHLRYLRSIYRKFAQNKKSQGFDYIILGHCHDLDQQEPFYWNMGYPPIHRQFIHYDSSADLVQRRNFP